MSGKIDIAKARGRQAMGLVAPLPLSADDDLLPHLPLFICV
jgi:hypothetical protein